jgi:hypothetical protein
MKKYIEFQYKTRDVVFIIEIEKKKYKKICREESYYPFFFANILKEANKITVKKQTEVD